MHKKYARVFNNVKTQNLDYLKIGLTNVKLICHKSIFKGPLIFSIVDYLNH